MASPADPSHPLTPPAEPSSQAPPTLPPLQTTSATQIEALLSQPATSLTDDGRSRRPRDHRLIHLLLASHGITAYQERVPLQLMDFAYRYTSSILSDALHIQSEGYDQADGATQAKGRGANKGQNKSEEGDVSLASLRLAIGSRMSYQFQGSMPKEFLKSLAEERNRIGLGIGLRDSEKSGPMIGGVKLPHERYCLTGVGWGLRDEWDSEGEESEESRPVSRDNESGDVMQLDELDEDENGMGTIEDVFGEDDGGGMKDGDDEDMEDS
jgi:transcription initiation factor TFIID subunit 9B